ncbi:MAG: cytochrome c [Ignavibacteria bacterium]|nr:cytochrome c [Ignavibacteria bacterium]
MKTSKILLLTLLAIGLSVFALSQPSKWVVPEAAKSVKNPTDKTNQENSDVGKSLYTKFCKSCHGKEGFGDGPKAKELDGKDNMGDFSSDEFQKQTDGTLFYKITKGKDDMPAFNKKIKDDEDRWLIVNYLRTLKQ